MSTNKKGLRDRTLSMKSSKAMSTLDSLRIALTDYETELQELTQECAINGRDKNAIVIVKNRLAQMSGEVEKLQSRGIDAVETFELVSAKDAARQERKDLNTRATTLWDGIQRLHSKCMTAL